MAAAGRHPRRVIREPADRDFARLRGSHPAGRSAPSPGREMVHVSQRARRSARARRAVESAREVAEEGADASAGASGHTARRAAAVIACPSCAADCPDGARFCPSCGAALAAGAARRRAQGRDHHVLRPRRLHRALRAGRPGGRRSPAARVLRPGPQRDRDLRRRRREVHRRRRGRRLRRADRPRGRRRARRAHRPAPARPPCRRCRRSPAGSSRCRIGINTGAAVVRLDVMPGSGEGFLVGDAVNTGRPPAAARAADGHRRRRDRPRRSRRARSTTTRSSPPP